ncbi:hypothetical protein AAU61_08210 [Desulfocarbo indianensis]|nr:hypothetical protein AAU61_08210 [Desulfocarbo indianensis]
MFGIGMPELIIILIVALLVVGPKKLPDLAKSLGKGLTEFRRATDAIKSELTENETYKGLHDATTTIKDTVSSMNPQQILDVKPILDPKKPEENLQARQELIEKATSGGEPPSPENQPQDKPADSQAAEAGQTAGEAKAPAKNA